MISFLPLNPSWVAGNMEVIAFVQDFESHEIFNGAKSPIQTVGTEDLHADNNLAIFPNPASDKITIKSSSEIKQVEIYNQVGQIVQQIKTNDNVSTLDVSEFEPRIYFIKVFSHDNIITQKLVIE